MARMPASRPTERIRADDWLPGEWVEVLTYAGAAVQEQLQDALTKVTMDPATMLVTATQYTPGNAMRERRRLAVVDWCLYEEQEPGKAGAAIPFTPENRDNLDPAYALYVDGQIREYWQRWRAATGQGTSTAEDPETRAAEDAQTRKTFRKGALPAAGRQDGPQDAGAVPA
jgi:hypothetical protein